MSPTTKPTAENKREADSLEMVREILLESDRKHTGELLDDLESRVSENLSRSQAAMLNKIDALTEMIEKRFADVEESLEMLDSTAEEQAADQAARVEQAKKSMRTALDRIDSEGKQRAKALRTRISATTEKLRDEGAQREARILTKLGDRIDAVDAESTSRQELSSLLAEVADQLSNVEG